MSGTKKPCPCGSGKPYEKCCGRRNICYSLDQVRWRHAGQALRRKLGEFADQPSFTWEAVHARDMYLGCIDQKLAQYYDEFVMERCFEWFIFDFYLSSGLTVIETFRQEYPYPLSDYENMLLKEWSRSRISLYEVNGVIPAEGLIIKDLLSHKELKVHDINAASEIRNGSILLIRVLKVGNEYEFSTSGLALPGWCKEPLLKRLHHDRQDYYNEKMKPNRGWGSYLKERAHKINAWVMEFGTSSTRCGNDSAGRRKVQNRITFNINNWQEALSLIKHSNSFVLIQELVDQSGVFQQAAAVWLGEPRRIKNGQEIGRPRLVLGNLILTPRSVTLITGSPELLSEGKELLRTLLIEFIGENLDEQSGSQSLTKDTIEDYPWPEPGYAVVAVCVREGLQEFGYNAKQQKGAMQLWFDYCIKERPSIRKTAVWAAAVIYAFARLEMEEGLKQQDLAGQYGVASSTISLRFRMLCQSLDLVAFDRRYSTKKPSLTGVRENNPLLTQRLLDNPRL